MKASTAATHGSKRENQGKTTSKKVPDVDSTTPIIDPTETPATHSQVDIA